MNQTKEQALAAAKSDPYVKAKGGFALVQVGTSRFEEDNEYDYEPTGNTVRRGEIIAKYRYNPNSRNQWKQIA